MRPFVGVIFLGVTFYSVLLRKISSFKFCCVITTCAYALFYLSEERDMRASSLSSAFSVLPPLLFKSNRNKLPPFNNKRHRYRNTYSINVVCDEASSPFQCERCSDTGYQTCQTCEGFGSLPSGGFSSKNSINFDKVLGTNWTALLRTKGWRHFEATAKRVDSETRSKFVTLSATCDREQTIEVPLVELKNREKWAAGWQQKENIEWDNEARDNSGALIGKPKRSRKACKRCQGEGKIVCTGGKKCKAGKAMQRQKLIQISVETRLKELSKSEEADVETKRKAKKAVKEMARVKEKEEQRKRELKSRFGGNDEEEDTEEDIPSGIKTKNTRKKERTDADGNWADVRLRKRDELLEKWIQGGSSASGSDDDRQ